MNDSLAALREIADSLGFHGQRSHRLLAERIDSLGSLVASLPAAGDPGVLWTMAGFFVAALGVLFTAGTIVAATIIYLQSKDFRSKIQQIIDESKQKLDEHVDAARDAAKQIAAFKEAEKRVDTGATTGEATARSNAIRLSSKLLLELLTDALVKGSTPQIKPPGPHRAVIRTIPTPKGPVAVTELDLPIASEARKPRPWGRRLLFAEVDGRATLFPPDGAGVLENRLEELTDATLVAMWENAQPPRERGDGAGDPPPPRRPES